jgi:hypothetical protein
MEAGLWSIQRRILLLGALIDRCVGDLALEIALVSERSVATGIP